MAPIPPAFSGTSSIKMKLVRRLNPSLSGVLRAVVPYIAITVPDAKHSLLETRSEFAPMRKRERLADSMHTADAVVTTPFATQTMDTLYSVPGKGLACSLARCIR